MPEHRTGAPVLYFSDCHTVHDERFIAAYCDWGYQVLYLLLSEQASSYRDRLPQSVVPVDWSHTEGPPTDTAQAVQSVSEILEAEKPALTHAGPIPTCGFIASEAKARPLVLMSWGSDVLVDARRATAAHAAVKCAVERADLVQCDARVVCETLRDEFGYRGRMVRFPWGVEPSMFPSMTPVTLPWSDKAIVIITVRSWAPIYDPLTALRAVAATRSREPRGRLVMANDGPLREDVIRAVDTLRLSDYVLLPGRLDRSTLADWYAAADIYLSSSLSDGTSVSMLEAMASGLPVVATDIPGNREWIDSRYLFKPEDPSECGRLLAELAVDASERRLAGKRNRRIAGNRANWLENVESLRTAISELP